MSKLFVFVLVIVLFLMLFTYHEGLDMPSVSTSNLPSTTSKPTIGKYVYLAPPPSPNQWNPDITTKFVNRYNSNLGQGNETEMIGTSNSNQKKTTDFVLNTLEEEVVFYINNGKFPINTYITDYLDANPTAIPSTAKLSNGTPITSSNISQFYSNRLIYAMIMYTKEMAITPPPESLQIFRGLKPPPNPSESKTTLSTMEFEQLKTVCRNIT